MLQFRTTIGLLTDGDTWFIFYADISSPDPSNDKLRVVRFERFGFGAGSEMFSGNPWAILLAALMLADPNGLPPRPRPFVPPPTVPRVAPARRPLGSATPPTSGPTTRNRARDAAPRRVNPGPNAAGQAQLSHDKAADASSAAPASADLALEWRPEYDLESKDDGEVAMHRRLVSFLSMFWCAVL